MKRSKRILSTCRGFLLMLMLLPAFGNAVELEFKGRLLNRPCRIDPEMKMQTVSFRDTATPLYNTWPGKSYAEKFHIKFINCQKSTMGKTLKLKFTGTEEKALPGYLQVSGVNQGNLGIGIIDSDGVSVLPLNHVHNRGRGIVVQHKNMVLNFSAFVQATPDAIAGRRVKPGTFDATASFSVMYE
ncbi:type 1 fimbrial protein [Salmonella enterica]|nr:type 1 fimbrial protein [Salmonella enterica]EGM2364018.1 type 1 fimbrial protein [Salmonella enterica]